KLEISQGRFVIGSDFNLKLLDYTGVKGVRERLEAIEMSRTMTLEEKIAAHDALISPEDTHRMVKRMVSFITSGEIPREFDDENHVEFEADDGPRSLEIALKINDMREWILREYGRNIDFVPDTVAAHIRTRAQIAKEDTVQELDPRLD